MTAKPMTIARFRKWKETRSRIPWDEIEATVIEVAALEQILKDEPEALMKRAMRAESALADLDTRVRLVLEEIRDVLQVKPELLTDVLGAAMKGLSEALHRVEKLMRTEKEKR